ncbi:hypothetical protein [Millisia brevis]|uniref:hypothetical protein n=1 Tax=Millisia brevis TaxID=264148 RepID=UPI0012ED5DA4|nr:hypothetical protein [Millisia brevis]
MPIRPLRLLAATIVSILLLIAAGRLDLPVDEAAPAAMSIEAVSAAGDSAGRAGAANPIAPAGLAVPDAQSEAVPAQSAVASAHGAVASAHSATSGINAFTNSAVLGESFARLEETFDGSVGIAIAPVGGGRVLSYGDWSTGDAWSTMKVPIAVAAVRATDGGIDADITAAITVSDNDAARRLWDGLAGTMSSVATIQALLTETGDTTPMAEQYAQQGDDSFGGLTWSLVDQVEFTARFPCLAGGARVIAEMRQLTEEHRWGLAADGAAAKGGWGPDAYGNYLVRQLGIVTTPTGRAAVTMAALPASGEFEDATAMLTAMAAWLSANRADLPSGRCVSVSR